MPSLDGGGLFSADGDEKRTSFSCTGNLPSDDDDDDPTIAGAVTVVDDDDVTSNGEKEPLTSPSSAVSFRCQQYEYHYSYYCFQRLPVLGD